MKDAQRRAIVSIAPRVRYTVRYRRFQRRQPFFDRSDPLNYRFSTSVQRIDVSAVREILKLTQGRSVISFAGGLPAEEFFPMDAVRAAYESVLGQDPTCLQYGLTEGYTPLRQILAARLCRQNIHATEDRILLTTGSQQAIDLLTRVYVDPGDAILVERPTYLAALQVFHSRE